MACQFGPRHPAFTLIQYPDGICDLSVCWDTTNVREIAKALREVASGLDQLPEDTTAIGIPPLH